MLMLRAGPRLAALVGVLVLVLGAAGCLMFEPPDGSIKVTNETDRALTIYYDNPNPSRLASPEQREEMNTLAVVEPDERSGFSVPGMCALAPVEAIDEDGVVVDSLPVGTCHDEGYVRWVITHHE